MRSCLVAGLVVASLACAGAGQDPVPPEPEPVVDPEPPPPSDEAIGLWWLEARGTDCAWVSEVWPDATQTVIATLPGTCPSNPTFVVGSSDVAAVFEGKRAWGLLAGAKARAMPEPPMALGFLTFDGKNPVGCADLDATREPNGDETRVRLSSDSKPYDGQIPDGAVDVSLARIWRLQDGGWTETATVIQPLYEGMSKPWCGSADGVPTGMANVSATDDPDGNTWVDPSESDRAALAKLAPDEHWSVSPGGIVAADSMEFEGLRLSTPVAWKRDGQWAVVPGLDQPGPKFQVVGSWLLTTDGTTSRLRDARTGQEVWSGPAATVAGDVPLPTEGAEEPDKPPDRAGRGSKRPDGGAKHPEGHHKAKARR